MTRQPPDTKSPDTTHNVTPSTTEEVPAAPGWVEQGVDEILGDPALGLRQGPALTGLRNAYLDCLASPGRGGDLDAAHDRCRLALLRDLESQQAITTRARAALEQKLEALEADLTAGI